MMKKTILVLACLVLAGAAMADPASPRIELALIDGGENGRNGGGSQSGIEATGDVGLDEHWYVGGIVGRFDRDSSGGDTTNTYFNAHGG